MRDEPFAAAGAADIGMTGGDAAALVTRVRVTAGAEAGFADWHAKMATTPGELSGFISTEIKAPPAPEDNEWSVIQRFRSVEEMRAWQGSDAHRRLLEEIGATVGAGGLSEIESVEAQSDSMVTEVITTVVKPGSEADYRQWAARIHAAEARFSGYRGGFLQPPTTDKQNYWTTLVRFATPQQLDHWLSSAEREDLLKEHHDLVESWTSHRLPTSFAGWFARAASDRESSTTLKQSMVVLLLLFPVVMTEMRFLSPILKHAPRALATFIGNAISVSLIGWPLMPIALVFLSWWLTPKKDSGPSVRVAGYALIGALYAAEIAALWSLL